MEETVSASEPAGQHSACQLSDSITFGVYFWIISQFISQS